MLILSCGMLEQCIPAAESYVAVVHVKEGWGEVAEGERWDG